MSVLELLDTLLGVLKNGIGFRGGRSIFVYARGVLNLAENILQRGGVSEEYRCAVDIYNELKEKLYSFSDKTSTHELDILKEKVTEAVNSIKSSKTEHLTQIKSNRSNALKTDVISAKAFGAASVGVLRMTARNPELFKSVRSNRAFLELALKCEEKQRRGFKLRRRFSMLVDELSERQTEFLRNFILENGLFSKTIEAGENTNELNNSKSILEFIANRSSFNELERFFSTFERRISSERHYNTECSKVFSSASEMRKFFKSADIPQLESFAEYLKSNSVQEQESEIMQNALDEYISLTRRLSELLQRTVEMIGQNAELSDYSREKLFENAEFAEIYSEHNSSSKENVTEKIYGENSEFVLSYGEYAVNRVRERGDVGAELRKSAEKIERILYYEQSESSLKADKIREIISSAGSEALKEFAEMLREFTGTDRLSITRCALYEYIGRFALNERLSEAEKLLKHVVRYNSNAEALEGEIERFAENNGSFSFWSVLERLGAADKLTGLYSVNNRTFERFSEWLESQLSDNETFSETIELIRAYSETRGLSENFERIISEIKSEKNTPEEYEKAYAEFKRTAENILTLIENSESMLEEELAVISEKLERFSGKDLADRAEIISEVERIFSALEEKEQFSSELSERPTQLLKDLDEMFSDEKISKTSVLSEIKSLMSNVDEYSNKEQNEFEKSIESAAENIRLVYAQSLIKSKLNTERETVNSLKSELEELKSDFSQKTENSERIERFIENVLRSFNAVKNKSLTENETADFKRLSEYLERLNNLNERSDLSRRKFTQELFEAITSDVTEERLNSAFFGNEIRTELVQKFSDKQTLENEKSANEKTFVEINDETRFSEYQNKLSKQIDVNYHELNKEYEVLSDMVYRGKEHKEDLNSISERVISRSEQKVSDIIKNHLKEQKSLDEIEKRMISSENESNEINEHKFTSSEFSELVMNNKTVSLGSSEKFAHEIIKAITYDETAKSISNTLNDIKNVLGTAGIAVFGIKQINSAAKSVVADKTLYKAVKNFYGEHTDELADFIEQKAYDYDLFYLRTGDNSEIFQENKLFRFSHDAVSRQIGREVTIHTAKAANSPYERIYSRLAEQNERTDYSGAELFYTEEYFDSPHSSVSVNYAVNAGKAEKSEEVSERLSGLNGKLEDISREIAEVRKSEQEMSTHFVLKSESSILEREIKSSIERDILLAGKRHGVL